MKIIIASPVNFENVIFYREKVPYFSSFWKKGRDLPSRSAVLFPFFMSFSLAKRRRFRYNKANAAPVGAMSDLRKGILRMSEEFGPTFVTVTDEDGNELVLEFIDALEYNGQMYQAFFPAETEGENEDDPDNGLVILKIIHENGEDLLSTLDSDEELDAVYEQFMDLLFDEEDE